MTATDQEFQIGNDGEVTTEAPQALVPGQVVGSVGIEKISQMIADPDSPIADITRLIALQIADVMKKMDPANPLDRGGYSMTDLNNQVKAYRELQKTLTEADALSKKDVLNLEGEKFKFVFGELLRFFKKAMDDGGIEEHVATNVMRQFGDLVRAHEPGLRVDLNKIGTGR